MKNFSTKLIVVLLILIYPVTNAADLISKCHAATPVNAVNTEDISAVAALEEKKAADIEKKIEKLNKANEKKAKEAALKKERSDNIDALKKQIDDGKTSYRQILKGTVIAGDSLMHGMYEYNVLDKANLVTKVSANLKHLESNISTIESLNPKVLVLHYGLNNMSDNDATIKNFVSSYEKLLLKLHEALPDTRIVVSSVFNVSAAKAKSSFSDVPKFNKALKAMCKKNGFEYLDNSDVLTPDSEYFEHDGMHVIKRFYTEKYLPNLVVALGL